MNELKNQTEAKACFPDAPRETPRGPTGSAGPGAARTDLGMAAPAAQVSAEEQPAARIEPEPASPPAGEIAPRPASVSAPYDLELEVWNSQVRKRMRHQSRRSFLGLGAGLLAGVAGFEWLTSRREIDGLSWPLRKTLEINEQISRDYFSTQRLSPVLKTGQANADRVNGDLGLDDDLDPAAWKLEVHGLASEVAPLRLGLDAIKHLPRTEMTSEFKCIEGWSTIVKWAGARFVDFLKAYPPRTISGGPFSLDHPEDLPPYVSMATPDGGYYVGLDIESLLHPQTLLGYEMNGLPLVDEHGAPLRLVIPVKYGVKNIKRLGTIRYSTLRPADYWAERGYDWYVGL